MTANSLPFDPTPDTEEGYEGSRSHLKRHFADWCKSNAPEVDGDVGETLIHQKWTFLDRKLTRWGCADLDQIYLDLHPAKVVIEPDELDSVLDEGRAFIAFMAETGWLDESSDEPERMIAHLDEIGPTFRLHMADESRFSPGKRFWSEAIAEGVQLDDEQSVNAFMDRYNARITGPRSPASSPFMSGLPAHGQSASGARRTGPTLRLVSGRATPPGTPPRQKQSSTKRGRRRR